MTNFDPATVPLLRRFDQLEEDLFPLHMQRLLSALRRVLSSRRGTRHRLQKAGILLSKLKGVRSQRALDQMLSTLTAKDVLSIWWYCLLVRNQVFRYRADTLGFQALRKDMGKRPNRLTFLRAVLKYAAASQS
jgi:hypothetical protein